MSAVSCYVTVFRPSVWSLTCTGFPLAGQLCWISAITDVTLGNEHDPQVTVAVLRATKVTKILFAFSQPDLFRKMNSWLFLTHVLGYPLACVKTSNYFFQGQVGNYISVTIFLKITTSQVDLGFCKTENHS